MMKKIWVGLGIVIVFAGVIYGITVFSKQRHSPTPPSKTGIPVSTPVQEEAAIEAFGTVKAKEVKNIFIDFPASITKLHVTEGQRVAYHQPLITLDITGFQAQIKSKELELQTANLDLHKLEVNLPEAEMYAQSKQEVMNREQGLLREKIALLETELGLLKEKLNRSYLQGNKVISDGADMAVYDIGFAEGDPANNSRKLLSLMDLRSLVVNAEVPEEFIKDVKIGARVNILPVADPGRTYQGTVTKIATLAVKQNGETIVPIEVAVVNKDGFLCPNYSVDLKIYPKGGAKK